ncbi:biotin-dependent carboxyltransferase family protein [Methylocella tundrae]|uniref:Urea amidolyase related protein n=1 Tax=Methylocella tundrae TaxID=227605 RepID=A0A4U8Z186_METTU|nr:biotin-dependent carboxyltransferase family protein [Methylocella tundrae]WPP06328.1 biotin-dependent carboxyltransferase family protein [Methylocella tundrae]VFU09024.1 Urea amidolyase related protein [Methylocella tundrae]
MAGRLRILSAGPGVTIQDAGRRGFLRFGVTPAGPMDWSAFETVLLALGNEDRAASIEISVGGLSVAVEEGAFLVAFAGGAFNWRRDGRPLPPAARIVLKPGEILSAQAGSEGAWAYLGVAGGFDTPVELGSRATHVRSGVGGLEGRMLRRGDVLPIGAAAAPSPAEEAEIDAPWLNGSKGRFRVLAGPQDDYFSSEALAAFFREKFTLTPAADRMAYRFHGAPVSHARGYNIVSDGVALGAIQIAGDEAPLILMADRQPTGGYPKLGHVIRADIGRLAQMRPGESCRFSIASLDEALAALSAIEQEIATTIARLRPLRRELTTALLLDANLIDGVVDALDGQG